jgi:hypothetical protein
MGNHTKSQKASTSGRRHISREKLLQKMSELISLREKIAQAELVAQIYGVTQAAHGEDFHGAGSGEDAQFQQRGESLTPPKTRSTSS